VKKMAPVRPQPCEMLQFDHVLGSQPFGTLLDLELDLVAFNQRSESVRLNCRLMHENIASGIPAYKSVAFLIIEPLDDTLLSHTLLQFAPARWRA